MGLKSSNCRVGLVTYSLRIGGVETFLHNLARRLRSHGYDVTFVETEHIGEWSNRTRNLGFNVTSIPRRPWLTRRTHCKQLATILSRFDVLLINDSPLAMAALGVVPAETLAITILHNAIESMIRNATANGEELACVVAVSPALKTAIDGYAHANADLESMCIPNGVPVPTLCRRERDTKEPLRVLYVGRLEQSQKNILALPRILASAIKLRGSFTFDVVGDGPDAYRLREDLVSKGIDFRFSGALQHSDVIDRMRSSDVLLLPSTYEGLPVTLLEAMSCGLVPLVSRLNGSTDFIIRDGQNGFLIDTIDEDDFARKLVLLGSDRDLLASMSSDAQNTIKERFSDEIMADAYCQLFSRLAVEKKAEYRGRSGFIITELLGDFPDLPYVFVRTVLKLLKLAPALN